jgi:putative ABC transport system ATP-binding protein
VRSLINTILDYHANRHLKSSNDRLGRWMDFLELREAVIDEAVETLSGGEKQRVAILIALLLERKVFLLDEITSYLDQGLKDKVAALFLAEKDWTVLSIAHDPCWRQPGVKQIEMEG